MQPVSNLSHWAGLFSTPNRPFLSASHSWWDSQGFWGCTFPYYLLERYLTKSLLYPYSCQKEISILAPKTSTLGKSYAVSMNANPVCHLCAKQGAGAGGGFGHPDRSRRGAMSKEMHSHSRHSQCSHLIPRLLTLNRHISQTTAIIHPSHPSACWSSIVICNVKALQKQLYLWKLGSPSQLLSGLIQLSQYACQ